MEETTRQRITALLDDYIDINGDVRDGLYEVAVAAIAAEIDAKDVRIAMLEAELEARRVVMAEQERIANMPRAYSAGG